MGLTDISGVRECLGEDLTYDSRTKHFKDCQRRWLNEQKTEKDLKYSNDKRDDEMYARQTIEITRMRGMLEDDHKQKKKAMEEATKSYNKIMAQAKKDSAIKDYDNQKASQNADLMQT